MLHSLFDVIKQLCVQQIADNDQTGSTLASFAVDCHNWVFQEHFFYNSQLICREVLSMIVLVQTILDVMSLLSHPLQE
jgi:hypothetical protein